jgi:hypothetical protein
MGDAGCVYPLTPLLWIVGFSRKKNPDSCSTVERKV